MSPPLQSYRHARVFALTIVCALSTGSTTTARCDVDKLLPSEAGDLSPAGDYGAAIAISANFAIVGAPGVELLGSGELAAGAAYVYRFDNGAWLEQARLVGSEVDAGDQFGAAVDIDGDLALVGAPRGTHKGVSSGTAYLFRRVAGTWIEESKFGPDSPQPGAKFGSSVSLHGNTLVAGAPCEFNVGAAFVFQRTVGRWLQTAYLRTLDMFSGSAYGYRVSLDGDHIAVVSAAASVLETYRRTGATWFRDETLTAPAGITSFARCFAIQDGTLYVDGISDNVDRELRVYVYAADAAGWTPGGDVFVTGDADVGGTESMDVDGDVLVMGRANQRLVIEPLPTSPLGSGAAYVLTRQAGSWSLAGRVVPRDTAWSGAVGMGVAAGGNGALVGATGFDGFNDAPGAVYDIALADISNEWSSMGHGLSGSADRTPCLGGSGRLATGEQVTLTLTDALPDTVATLVLGTSTLPLQTLFGTTPTNFAGGYLVPATDSVFFGIPTGPGGTFSVQGAVPAGLPAGIPIYVQVWVSDAGASSGLAGSNAMVQVTE